MRNARAARLEPKDRLWLPGLCDLNAACPVRTVWHLSAVRLRSI